MDIHIAAKYMQLGYRVRRTCWESGQYLDWESLMFFQPVELLVEDWEVITQGIIKDFPVTYQE